MEDKMFELMTKMYSDLTTRLDSMDKKIDSMKGDIVRIENKLDTNSQALFDGYNQVYDKVVSVENSVNDLSAKVEKQEVEIRVIKAVK